MKNKIAVLALFFTVSAFAQNEVVRPISVVAKCLDIDRFQSIYDCVKPAFAKEVPPKLIASFAAHILGYREIKQVRKCTDQDLNKFPLSRSKKGIYCAQFVGKPPTNPFIFTLSGKDDGRLISDLMSFY